MLTDTHALPQLVVMTGNHAVSRLVLTNTRAVPELVVLTVTHAVPQCNAD